MTYEASHPSVKELTAFVSGQLPESQASDVERHIDLCDPCTQTLIGLSTDDTLAGLIKEAGNPATHMTMGATHLDLGSASNATKEALAEHSRYEIVELIAQGGMGKVFKATHLMMDRTVALKVIKNQLMRNTEVIERFHREVKAAAQLSHPNIVTAYDAEQANGVHFLVMEYVEGTTLSDLVKRDGQLPIAKAVDYARQAATGLQHAHEHGMVHRDMKPHNLMLTTDGTVKILDFGLASLSSETIAASSDSSLSADASLTNAGCVMGTPDFISPEQATDAHQADIRSDIYSLGATLYYLLSGQPPFSNGGVAERLKDHAETAPVPMNQLREEVPQELADIVSRMLAKDPAERFGSPKEVESALALLAVDQSTRAMPKQATSRWIPRTAMALIGGAIAAVLGLALFLTSNPLALGRPLSAQDADIRESVVKIKVTRVDPNFYEPWKRKPPRESGGTGAIIGGNRIITNAHVVGHAKSITVQGFQSDKKVSAKVIGISKEQDLAVLSVDDEEFFEGRPALEFMDELPTVKDKVNAYGFPIGGAQLSVTEGIVSRIDFSRYPTSSQTQGLRIQIDAAINPGNSGGPAVKDGKIVGLVFSGNKTADNIGYLIPVEEIRLFLDDIKDGTYDGKLIFPRSYQLQTLENETLRRKLRLSEDMGGILVKKFTLEEDEQRDNA